MDTENAEGQGPYYDYDVIDSSGNKVGRVEGVWIEEGTDQPEFVGVETNWLLKGKVHVVPLANAEFNEDEETIQVPYSEVQIKHSPDVGRYAELSQERRDQICQYFGLERAAATAGVARGAGTAGSSAADAAATDAGYTTTETVTTGTSYAGTDTAATGTGYSATETAPTGGATEVTGTETGSSVGARSLRDEDQT